jgi:hypothetical protein
MKKIMIAIVLNLLFLQSFSQTKDTLGAKKMTVFETFIHKGKIFNDTYEYTLSKSEKLKYEEMQRKGYKVAFKNKQNKSLDSIPKNAPVYVNNVLKISQKYLKYLPSFEVVHVEQAKYEGFYFLIEDKLNANTSEKIVYETVPKGIIYQSHKNLPTDFVLFDKTTAQSLRFSCSVKNPLWDFMANSNKKSTEPIYVVDGRMQKEGFQLDLLNEKEIKSIEVFDNEDGTHFYGYRASNGIVAITTKNNIGYTLPALRNIHVVGEIEYKTGKWKIISDTTLENINDYWDYRKHTFAQNGPVYMIGGEEETYEMNRKTVSMSSIVGIDIKRDDKSYQSKIDAILKKDANTGISPINIYPSDTVFIKIGQYPDLIVADTELDGIMKHLYSVRGNDGNSQLNKIPIYILDNQEITSEKLKEFKSKELEFVESLEGCDAISRYGKRAEYGVVIYRKKKLE